MYNQNLKNQFIESYSTRDSVKKFCVTVFEAFEKYELEWGADLCTRTADELQPALSKMVGFRSRSKLMRIIILKDYVRWCIGMSVDGACDGMFNITNVGLDKVKIQTVANPQHLQQYLDAVCSPEDERTTDNIYRCYYWLAYAGMDEEDILKVQCKDVDFRNMVVNYPRKMTTVPLYPQSLKAFHNCVECDTFVFKHPNYTKPVDRQRADGTTLVRGIRSESTLSSIRMALSRLSKQNEDKTPLRLSYFRVWISGVFHRMYEREIAGEAPYFDDIVAEQMEGKTYKLDSGRNTMAAKHRQLVRDYEEDYQRWKLAWLYRGV